MSLIRSNVEDWQFENKKEEERKKKHNELTRVANVVSEKGIAYQWTKIFIDGASQSGTYLYAEWGISRDCILLTTVNCTYNTTANQFSKRLWVQCRLMNFHFFLSLSQQKKNTERMKSWWNAHP